MKKRPGVAAAAAEAAADAGGDTPRRPGPRRSRAATCCWRCDHGLERDVLRRLRCVPGELPGVLARDEALGHDGRRGRRWPTSVPTATTSVSDAVRAARRAASSRKRRACASKTCSEPRWNAVLPSPVGGCRKRLHSMGVRVSETKPEIRIATLMVTANSWNSRPMMPPMNSTGMNTAASDSVIERMVKPISRAPSRAACSRVFAHLHVADDVLQHHDGVVHHEADRQRQRHQREVVERVAQQVHHGEGADDRHAAAPGWE